MVVKYQKKRMLLSDFRFLQFLCNDLKEQNWKAKKEAMAGRGRNGRECCGLRLTMVAEFERVQRTLGFEILNQMNMEGNGEES